MHYMHVIILLSRLMCHVLHESVVHCFFTLIKILIFMSTNNNRDRIAICSALAKERVDNF